MKLQEAFRFDTEQFRKLRQLVARGEGQGLEFKRKAAFPEKIVREMVAFANTKGGILLLGVGDDGSIPGLKYAEDESHVIKKALKLCFPPIKYSETFIPVGKSCNVIQYEIPESFRKPHYVATDGGVRESFVRVTDKTIKASREMREILRRSNKHKNIKFHYGEHEKFLMQYLDTHPNITLKEFTQQSSLKRFLASKKLVLLVLANVLRVTPHEKGDLYSLTIKRESSLYN